MLCVTAVLSGQPVVVGVLSVTAQLQSKLIPISMLFLMPTRRKT